MALPEVCQRRRSGQNEALLLPETALVLHLSVATMDTLVARYSRPAFEQNEPFENEAQEMMDATSSLTTKFAMPPISQVRRLTREAARIKAAACSSREICETIID